MTDGKLVDDPQIPFCEDRGGRAIFLPTLATAKAIDIELLMASSEGADVSFSGEQSPWKILLLSFLVLISCLFGSLSIITQAHHVLRRYRDILDILARSGRSALIVILLLWTVLFYRQGARGVYLAGVVLFDFYAIWLLCRKIGYQQASAGEDPIPKPLIRAVLLTLAVAICAVLGSISSIRHHNVESRAFDLAIQENVLWNSVHGDPFLSSVMNGIPYLGNHTVLAYILILPLYYLLPSTYTLLCLQAAILSAAALPLFLVGRRLLGSELAAGFIAASFLLHPGILGAGTNDFHELAFAPFALAWVAYAVVFRRPLLLAVLTLVASCIKEDMSVNLMALGVGLVLVRRATYGVYLFACGIVSYVVWQNIVIPTFAGFESSYTWYLTRELADEVSPSGVLYRILSGPFSLIVPLVDKARGLFLLHTLGAFLFIPGLRLGGVAMTSYGIALVALSGHPPLYTLGYHYIFPWLTLATLAYLFVVNDMKGAALRNLSSAGVFSAHVILFAFFGPIYPFDVFRYGPVATKNPFISRTSPELVSAVAWAKSVIPPEASVVTTETLAPHFSTRKRIVVGNRARTSISETFDYCLGERETPSTTCQSVHCSGEELKGPYSALLLCRRRAT